MDENNNVVVRVGDQEFVRGEDGYSPVVTVEEIEHGHSVNITDREHLEGQSFDVMDGASAYEQAVAGGYTDTEAQFNADLSSFKTLHDEVEEAAPFYAEYGVTTRAEVYAAINNKRQVYVNTNTFPEAQTFPLTGQFYASDWRMGYRFTLIRETAQGRTLQLVCELTSEWNSYYNDLTASADRAEAAAAAALNRMNSADQSAQDAEAYAVGKRKGIDVDSTDPAYHNNAKYYAEQAGETVNTFTETTVPAAVQTVNTAGQTQVGAVNTAGQTQTQAVNTAGQTALTAVSGAQTAAVSAVQTESATQQTAIQQKGDDVLESIPSDYTDLSDDVDDLKSAKAPVIIDTASGTIASFEDGADGMPIKALTINIEPVQSGSGDPSPTNVRPIVGWTKCNIANTSKNIFNVDDAKWVSNHLINGNGIVTPNDNYRYCANYTPIIGGRKITVSAIRTSSGAVLGVPISFYDNQKNFLTRIATFPTSGSAGTVSATVDVPSEAAYFRLNLANNPSYVSDLMIEYGDAATEYEPFASRVISWEGIAGTVYGGTLDVTNGVLTVVYAAKTFTNNDAFSLGSYNQFVCNVADMQIMNINTVGIIACDRAKPIAYANRSSDENVVRIMIVNNSPARIELRGMQTLEITTVDQLKTWLQDNPITIVYPLAAPVPYQLTAQQITTLLGTNNVWADCGDVSVDYPADTKLYIQKINAPTDDDMTADTQIASGKYFLIGNTLYLSTTIIPAGDTIIPGTNCTKTNLAAALNALNA